MIDGRAIRAARKAARMTQVDLARAVGMTQQTVAAIEKGLIRSTKFLPRIALALNKHPDELDVGWLSAEEQRNSVLPASVEDKDLPVYIDQMKCVLQARSDRKRIDEDYAFFAGEILRIRTKSGLIEPLVFNRAQQHIHEALQAQLAELGRVRALILKGRQQGCSTYIGGGAFYPPPRHQGLPVFILSHTRWGPHPLFSRV